MPQADLPEQPLAPQEPGPEHRLSDVQSDVQSDVLAQALATIANAIFITDNSGRIVWVNDAFIKLSGYSQGDIIGRTPAILQSGKQDHVTYARLWKTIHAGNVWQGEMVDQRKDGTLYIVDQIITPLIDEQGATTHFIAIQHDITRQKQENERDRYLARHDALTNLPNRADFFDVLQQAITQAQRTQQQLAVLFLDLDKFKPINDLHGHHTGDLLLTAVAARLRAALRHADVVARLGGDEFAILLTDLADIKMATSLARKLLDTLAQPFVLRGCRLTINASIGVAMYPADGDEPTLLLAAADRAMYAAKTRGGNNYELCKSEDMTAG